MYFSTALFEEMIQFYVRIFFQNGLKSTSLAMTIQFDYAVFFHIGASTTN